MRCATGVALQDDIYCLFFIYTPGSTFVMNRFYLALLWVAVLSGLMSTRLLAQANFQPGYVLPLAGDTLRGEVDLQEGRLNAKACRFRPMAAAEVVA